MEEVKSLVLRAQAGDLEAYGEIVRRFQDMAYGYAYSVLRDFHLAEDAAQEAFIEAYRCLAKLWEPAAFPGWFRRIVFKHCDRITRRKPLPTAPLEQAGAVMSGTPEPTHISEARELQDRVLEAVRALPEQERTVTTLYYIDGYSYREVSSFLGVPLGTVKRRLHEAREILKGRLAMVEEHLKRRRPGPAFSRRVLQRIDSVNVKAIEEGAGSLLLTDKEGRSFVMMTGKAEADSINLALQGTKPPRPLTHDLFVTTIGQLGGTIVELAIFALQRNRFYAVLVVRQGRRRHEIDCRPSDGVALAVRAGAPIYVHQDVVERAVMKRKDGRPLSPRGALRAFRKTEIRAGSSTEEERKQLAKHPAALQALDKATRLLMDWDETRKSETLKEGLAWLDAYLERRAHAGEGPLLPMLPTTLYQTLQRRATFQKVLKKHGLFADISATGMKIRTSSR